LSFDALANEDFWAAVALFATGGYLLGSIPFGLLLTRGAGLGDVRAIGSGNIGATNVLRTGRKDLALLTLLLDGGKGAVAVLAARFLLLDFSGHTTFEAIAGGAAFLGHLFPVWLKFKGGKGVATWLGAMLAIAWPVGLAAAATWALVAALFRYSSLAAIVAAALTSTYAALLGQPRPVIVLAVVMGVLVLIKHRGNFARLRAGTEPRIGGAKTPA
jgi:glycerol-3-phosphate acyltransferase PlsY